MEPLTPAMFLSDMTGAIPGYNEGVARMLKALASGIRMLSEGLNVFKGQQPPPALLPDGVDKGIPYFLRYGQRCSIYPVWLVGSLTFACIWIPISGLGVLIGT
jgi:hypothetical protein